MDAQGGGEGEGEANLAHSAAQELGALCGGFRKEPFRFNAVGLWSQDGGDVPEIRC